MPAPTSCSPVSGVVVVVEVLEVVVDVVVVGVVVAVVVVPMQFPHTLLIITVCPTLLSTHGSTISKKIGIQLLRLYFYSLKAH